MLALLYRFSLRGGQLLGLSHLRCGFNSRACQFLGGVFIFRALASPISEVAW